MLIYLKFLGADMPEGNVQGDFAPDCTIAEFKARLLVSADVACFSGFVLH